MSLAQQAGFMDIVGLSCFSGSCSVVGEFKSWEWKWEVQWQQDKVWWYSECRGGNFAAAVAIVVVAIPESLLLWVTSRRGWWALPWCHHHFYWQMGQPFVEPRWKWFGIINIERGQLRQAFCNWICYNHNIKCSNNDSPHGIHYIISLCLAAIELLIPILIFWIPQFKRQTNDTTRTTKATQTSIIKDEVRLLSQTCVCICSLYIHGRLLMDVFPTSIWHEYQLAISKTRTDPA